MRAEAIAALPVDTLVRTAYLWQNGMTMVFDEHGEQIPALQDQVSPQLVAEIRARADAATEWIGFGEDGRAVWPR